MVCRNVSCNLGLELNHGQCVGSINIQKHTRSTDVSCFSTFFKLTPLHKKVQLTRTIIIHDIKFMDALKPLVDLPSWFKYGFRYFLSSDVDHFVEYAIIHIILPLYQTSVEKMYRDFFASLNNIGSNNVSILSSDLEAVFSVDIAHFNFSYENRTVSLPSDTGQFITTLTEISRDSDWLFSNCSELKTMAINKLNVCPFVSISVNEYDIEIKTDTLIFNVNGTQTKVYSKWEFEQHGDKLYMCLEDYIDVYNAMPTTVNNRGISETAVFHPKNIVSLVCVSLSIVCLLVTITIHMFFSVLRSQAGINNMMLAIFLLLAQSFYQFGAGQTSIASWACSLIGGICHFMWLATMFSMTVCCTHMLMIFKKGMIISQASFNRKTVKNLVYVTCGSLLFVLINLSVSFVVSGGLNSGYGGEICYLSSPLMQLITFVLPSALALLANLCMFVNVVCKIWNIGRRSTSLLNKERNYLRVYARLSALAGLTWIFGLLQLFLEFEVLEYIFIILNASQGVFIMLAFVINKRVYSLICKKGSPIKKHPVQRLQKIF